MRKPDNLETLFQEHLENLEGEVGPDVWKGIQQQLPNVQQPANAGQAASGMATSKVTLWAVTGAVAVATTVGGIWFATQDEGADNTTTAEQAVENTITDVTEQPTSPKSEQLTTTPASANQPAEQPSVEGATTLNAGEENTTESSDNSSHVVPESTTSPNQVSQQTTELDGAPQTAPSGSGSPTSGEGDADQPVGQGEQIVQPIQQGGVPEPIESATPPSDATGNENNRSTRESVDPAVTPVSQPDNSTAVQQPVLTVPNVFTPNGDGLNDSWEVEVQHVRSYILRVYNANGRLVFESQDPSVSWNGQERDGTTAAEGTYFYQLTATGIDGKQHTKRASVTLRR